MAVELIVCIEVHTNNEGPFKAKTFFVKLRNLSRLFSIKR